MADRRTRSRNATSAKHAFTRSWQSSKVPSTATLCTLGASTVVICRRWTSLTRPSGWSTTMSRVSRPTQASMAAEPVSPEVATTIVARLAAGGELVVEQATDELQGDVLERQRRAVEQLEQVQPVDLDHRAHVGVVEGGVGLGDEALEVGSIDRAVDVGPHHLDREVGVGPVRRIPAVGQLRPVGGDVEAAVVGQSCEQHVAEAELGRVAAGGDVLQHRTLSRRPRRGGPTRWCGPRRGPRSRRGWPARLPRGRGA